jgi:hypothetical protein
MLSSASTHHDHIPLARLTEKAHDSEGAYEAESGDAREILDHEPDEGDGDHHKVEHGPAICGEQGYA